MLSNGASIVVFKRVRIIENTSVSSLVYVLIYVSSKEGIPSNISLHKRFFHAQASKHL
jgi:hypothetical protein